MAQWSVKIELQWWKDTKVEAANTWQARKLAAAEQNWVEPKCAQEGVQLAKVRVIAPDSSRCSKISAKGEQPAVYEVRVWFAGDVEVELAARDARAAETLARRFFDENFDAKLGGEERCLSISCMWLPRKLTSDTVEDVLGFMDEDNERALDVYNSRVEEERSRLIQQQARFILDAVKKLEGVAFPVATPVGEAGDYADLVGLFMAVVVMKAMKGSKVADLIYPNYLDDLYDAIRRRVDSGHISWLYIDASGDIALQKA